MFDLIAIGLAVLASVAYLLRCFWRWRRRLKQADCPGCNHCKS